MSSKEGGPLGIGIDFGTTNSLVAIHRPTSGATAICTDKATGLPHPSVVWYRLDEDPRVGREAKRQVSGYADVAGNVFIQSVKRQLGRRESFDVFGEKKSPEAVSSDIFRYLLRDARENYKFDVSEAIVTVPVYFDGRARRELRRAADAAGLYVKAFLHEPFAALIGYVCRGSTPESLDELMGQNILVFDWGGGTLDITVGRVEERRIVELATAGLADRAGDLFDEMLGRVGKRKFQERTSVSPEQLTLRPATKDRYRAECERCKIALSDQLEQPLEIADFLRLSAQVLDLSETIGRNDFEEEILAIVDDAGRQVDLALEKAGLTPRQIDLVLLIGGSSRIPLVQQQLRERFGHTVVDVPNANSIIAEGAAIADALGFRPAFAASVAVELSDGTHHDIFKAGELVVPDACNKAVNLFCTDNRGAQARLIVGLADGANGAFDRKKIITLPVSSELPRPYNHERVVVNFLVDEDLVLHVDAKAATQPKGVHDEIVDLRFAVSFAGV